MPRIRQSPPLVVTKIATGAVIEWVASVLKGLLENAGRRRIVDDVDRCPGDHAAWPGVPRQWG